jgi:diguanylate cyclase (GGDEF)-like protein/hemerythrin-like metal-binding protein/PAS domain S-box-containing protein
VREVFVWNARYETGLEIVDRQHQRLVELLNQLGQLHAREGTLADILKVFDELAAYAVYHFQTEERLMAEMAISQSHAESHLAAHAEFIRQAQGARQLVEKDPLEATGRLLTFLTRWLITHILGVDRRMVAEVLALRAQKAPAEAARIAEEQTADVTSVLLEAMGELYEDLALRNREYQDANRSLQSEIAERERTEAQLALRLRELSCSYRIGTILERKGRSFERTMEETVVAMAEEGPWGSDIAVRLSTERGTWQSAEIPAEGHRCARDISIDGRRFGSLEIACKAAEADCPVEANEDACLLLEQLTERLAQYIETVISQEERRKLSLAVEQSPVSIVITDRQAVIEYVNPTFCELTGYSAEEVIGQNPRILKSGLTPVETYKALWESIRAGWQWRGELRNRKKSGELYWESASISPIMDDEGNITHYLGVKEDITGRKTTELTLKERNQQLARSIEALQAHSKEMSLLNQMSDLIQTCIAPDEVYAIISRIAGELFDSNGGTLSIKSSQGTLFEKVSEWGQGLECESVYAATDCWALRRGQVHHSRGEDKALACKHLIRLPPGGVLCVPMVVSGETLGALSVACDGQSDDGDIANWRQLAESTAETAKLSLSNFRLREALRQQAVHDALTGLYNRRYFDETLLRELARAERGQTPLCLVMLDIDHFKRFNDEFGHDAGDVVLRSVARTLAEGVRQGDVICRFGGEELAAIFADTQPNVAFERTEKLLESVRCLALQYRGVELPALTLSAGIACSAAHGRDALSLIRAADEALYMAKQAGRNCVRLHVQS